MAFGGISAEKHGLLKSIKQEPEKNRFSMNYLVKNWTKLAPEAILPKR
jgi:hypothetical protein